MDSQSAPDRINVHFSHMGLVVKDIALMEDFYTRVIGFERTDGGKTGQGVTMIFMTLDPREHHQVFLVEGRPDNLPTNTIIPGGGAVLHHMAFRLDSLGDLQRMYRRIVAESDRRIMTATHGVCWTMYTQDPEGNGIEFFADTPWYCHQPYMKPMDFNKDEQTLMAETEALCRAAPGFRMYDEFYDNLGERLPAHADA